MTENGERREGEGGREGGREESGGGRQRLAIGETVILLHPPLPFVGDSIWMERGCQ